MTDKARLPITDVLAIAVRAYGVREGKRPPKLEFSARGPSPWFLIFDCETTTDAAQRLRVGVYQLREGATRILRFAESIQPAKAGA